MIIVRMSGGMGNQMFQYALGRSLAIKNNTTLGLDTHELLDRTGRPKNFTFRTYDLDMFATAAQPLSQADIPLWYRATGYGKIGFYFDLFRKKLLYKKGKEKYFHYDDEIVSLGSNAYLIGYWQSYKYFEAVAETIRKDFTLVKELPQYIQKLKEEITTKNSVCIHIRRGDYIGNTFHEVVNNAHYEQAIELLKGKTDIEHLYVFSDDIEWCRVNLSFGYSTTFVSEEYSGERASGHFELMRSCRHFIIPNSSFAWWAAWLANAPDKIVIAPKRWFNDDSINTSDIIPPTWIRI